MKQNLAIAIFVKTPGISPLKTRLAKGIGSEKALLFYKKSIIATQALIKSVQIPNVKITPYFSIAEMEGMDHLMWAGFERIFQGEGNLGDRLNKSWQELKKNYQSVVFLGGDSPHLSPDLFKNALEKITSDPTNFFLGKTIDGGFYLFGGSSEIPSEAWTNVEYSTNSTSKQLINQIKKDSKVNLLEESFDIDESDDLKRYKSLDVQGFLSEQKDLINWVNLECL
ncbi:MAG: DUF2064 domain-containing protein [Bacteriovoracaceae bacterium]|nr:DUF2064 domain-containing protein [Bacteriovoracaceae bacterium]